MRCILTILLLITWGLWFGGTMALFLFVTRFFSGPRDLAVVAAPVLFVAFAPYQLILGLICCATSSLLAWVTQQKPLAIAALLLLVSLVLSVFLQRWTVELMKLDRTIPDQIARFQVLHRNSGVGYSTSAVMLLLAGVILGLILSPRPLRS